MARTQPRRRDRDATRELILETFSRMVVEEGLHDVSVQQVADRAGVTHRTVYRHFESRQALVDQLAVWLDQRLADRGGIRVPANAGGIAEAVERNYRLFDEEASFIKALVLVTYGARSSAALQEERSRAFAEALAPLTAGLGPVEARCIAALFRYLASSRTWLALREEFGLEGKESGPVLAWIFRTLLKALEDRSVQGEEVYTVERMHFMTDQASVDAIGPEATPEE